MPEDAYLWDKSGQPDAEIVELERALSQFAAPPIKRRRPVWLWAAIAAALMVGVAAWRLSRPVPSAWQLESGRMVALGEKVMTGPEQETRLEASAVGMVKLEGNSTLQVVRSGEGEQRLSLSRGTLHALIWAPAKSFAVETPAGTSIDLGCAYTLTVDGEGGGLVSVSTGWVAFQAGGNESFIPAGAACRTLRQIGPSLPYFTDATAKFTGLIARWERSRGVAELLAEARPRDGLTLWHLLQRTESQAERRQVAQRMAALIPAVNAEGLERGDPAAITEAWNALGLGSAEWWRSWKHPWAG